MVVSALRNTLLDVNMQDSDGFTAIMRAAHYGYLEVVTILLDDERVDPNVASATGKTSLILATEEAHASVVAQLLADPRVLRNAVTTAGRTALMSGARTRQGRQSLALRMLLNDPLVDCNIRDENGDSALMLAAELGNLDTVNQLRRWAD